jgi:hypothetical protein
MSTSFDSTIVFPLREFTRLPPDRTPRYANVVLLQQEMNTCTTSIQHPNTPFGYASISYREADYLELSGGIPFVIPVHPGALLVIPPGTNTAGRADLIRNYNDEKSIWAKYNTVESALKRLVLEAVNIDWFSSLMHPTHRLALVTCRQMITHLWENFGIIDELDLIDNAEKLVLPWHPETSIVALFARLEQCQTFSIAGGNPLTDTSLYLAGYETIVKTGQFTVSCQSWRALPLATRNYALFKTVFRAAHQELTKTSSTAGYHSANAVKEAARDAAFEKLSAEFLAFKAEVKKNAKSVPNSTPKPKLATDKKDMSYCWTHGYMTNTQHTSATCKSKGPGHVAEATADNHLGGCATVWQPKTKQG